MFLSFHTSTACGFFRFVYVSSLTAITTDNVLDIGIVADELTSAMRSAKALRAARFIQVSAFAAVARESP